MSRAQRNRGGGRNKRFSASTATFQWKFLSIHLCVLPRSHERMQGQEEKVAVLVPEFGITKRSFFVCVEGMFSPLLELSCIGCPALCERETKTNRRKTLHTSFRRPRTRKSGEERPKTRWRSKNEEDVGMERKKSEREDMAGRTTMFRKASEMWWDDSEEKAGNENRKRGKTTKKGRKWYDVLHPCGGLFLVVGGIES